MRILTETFRRSLNVLGPWSFGFWFSFVFVLYFSVHSLDLSFFSVFFQDLNRAQGRFWVFDFWVSVQTGLVCLSVGLATWRLGRYGLRSLRLEFGSKMLCFCFETALGVVFLDLFWMALGLNGLWNGPFDVVLVTVFCLWALVDLWRDMPSLKVEWAWKLDLRSGPFLIGLTFAFIGLEWAQVWTPVTYFDGLVYHLSTLSFWAFHHGFAPAPGNFFTCFPFSAELYLWNGMVLQGTQAAKGLNILFLFWTALAAGSWVAEEGTPIAGVLTGLTVLFLPLLSTTVWSAQNDVVLTFFILLFVYSLRKAMTEGTEDWFLLAGLMGGAAWTVKQTAVLGVGVVWLAGLLVWARSGFALPWKRWMGMITLVGLCVLPWLLKNAVYTGNPVYPYLSPLIGGQVFPKDNELALMVAHESPWVMDHSFTGWMVHILTQSLDKTMGPVFLAFVPFWFIARPSSVSSGWVGWTGLSYLILCFVVSHQLRLAIPACVLLVVETGLALNVLQKANVQWWSWFLVIFGTLSFISLLRVSVTYYQWDKVVLGDETPTGYLETNPQTRTYYGLTEAVKETTAPWDRILLVGDSRSLYYRRDFYVNSIYDRQVLRDLAVKEKDGEGIYQRLKEMGIDDLVVSGWEAQRLIGQDPNYFSLNQAEWTKLDDLIQHRTDLAFQEGLWAIYHLRTIPIKRSKPLPNLLLVLKSPVPNP